MFTVTHSIQAAIPQSTCYEVSSNERTLNLPPYPMPHSTLTLSTINLTAAHNIYHRNTKQAAPNTTHKPSVPAAAFLTLNIVLLLITAGCLNS